MKKISLVIPFYNEFEVIDIFHKKIIEITNQLSNYEFEFICVNDGSKDQTLESLIKLHNNDQRFKIFDFSRNFGKEAALTAGIENATGDAIIPIDSDLQDPPELIFEMIKLWEHGYEVVLAKRENRESDGYLKRTTANLFYSIHNQLSSVKIPHNVGDYRLMDRIVVEALKKLPEHNRFMKGLFAWVGFKTVTINYTRPVRASGQTKFSGWKLWNLALEGITSFSAAPLKFWTYIGAFGALTSFIYALYIIIRTIVEGVDLPGYASIFSAVIFFGSLQLLSIGILGEYIGRIYLETKNRPNYLIRKKII